MPTSEKQALERITVCPQPFSGTFGEMIGYDLCIHSSKATLADFLIALNHFATTYIADCRGCDGCCKERAPLTSLDITALATLLDHPLYPAHQVCAAFASLTIDHNGATDIILKREWEGCCNNLDIPGKFCTIHPQRPFVCRSHFCLPKSHRFTALREEVTNLGENELTRLLLAEEANQALPLAGGYLATRLNPADYPENPLTGLISYEQAVIKDIVSPQLWTQLCQE
ncbi:MAG: YkgJ family cysteine cluster protein [Clostridiales bacterium]